MRILITGILLALVAASPVVQPRDSADDVKHKLTGNWKLVKYESVAPTASGNPPAGYDDGRIMYDAQGNMAAQLWRKGRPKVTRESSPQDRLAAAAGYVAYYGTYEVDTAKGAVTHHVVGSTNASWEGTPLVRYYEFSPDGNTLTLSIRSGERTTGKLTWERLR